MNNMMKVSLLIPSMRVSDVRYNAKEILALIDTLKDDTAITLLPELSLTGYTSQDLFFQLPILNEVEKAITQIKEETKERDTLIVLGAPLRKENKLYNCAVFIHRGKVIAAVPKSYIPNYGEFYEARWFASGKDIKNDVIEIDKEEIPFGTDILIKDKNSIALIGAEICEDLWVMDKPSTHMALAGANIILNLSASDETIQKSEYRRNLVSVQSATTYSAYLYCSSGNDESSTDLVFSGHSMIAENGSILSECKYPNTPSLLSGIIDLDKIEYNRLHQTTFENGNDKDYRIIPLSLPSYFEKETVAEKAEQLKDDDYFVSPYPFVPSGEEERKNRCLEILSIQAHGLATRVKKTGLENLVIGISGGLDSTLALLVAKEAKKIIPSIHIIGVTMPNTGNTSSITYENAVSLLNLLADERKEIEITRSVKDHLEDIGHSLSYNGKDDVTYENAQARYRTYILMDLANMMHGLVVGTGDLSELALGWCTYNGDHMSMYGVNSSVPKTLVKYIVEAYANFLSDEKLKATLLSIISTPISPELTPNENGEIKQKTEDRIGKYDLNDFFLYYVLRYGFEPNKIIMLALVAYPELNTEEIKEALIRFYQRFYSQQFKRSCLPDGVKVGSVTLSPRGDFRMASDASASLMIEKVKECK